MSSLKSSLSNLTSIFIVGQTASGKSSLAMKLALKIGAEIVCADSQTLRKKLDFGTAKPSYDDQLKVKHHMIDIIEPYERYSVAQYQKEASKIVDEIKSRDHTAIIVGGSGLYIDSLFFNYGLESDQDLSLKKELESKTVEQLQSIINENDYEMPKNSSNLRHLVGVILRRGLYQINNTPVKNTFIYGLTQEEDELKRRISLRVDEMFKSGLENETRDIIEEYGKPPDDLDAIGYGIVSNFIDGKLSEEEARDVIKRGHWQYARRQRSWFKRNKYIQWFDDSEAALKKIVQDINTSTG